VNRDRDAVAAECQDPVGRDTSGAGAHAVAELAEPGSIHQLDGGGDRREDPQLGRVRLRAGKSARKLFGDEAGGQPAFPPTRMRHQGRKERDVVADAVDGERVSASAMASTAAALVGAWVQSLAIIGS
jgi:hypothetical protein